MTVAREISETKAREVAERMAAAASKVIEALSPEQRLKVSFDFGDETERRNWGYFPREWHGLPLKAMTSEQQQLVHGLVATGVSLHAYAKVTTIIALESVLGEIEGHTFRMRRDPAFYFLSIFGAPGDPAAWGWRFEGHHVSLNFTIVDGELVAPTPIFFGSNPAEVRHGELAVLRVLAEEDDLARTLLESLSLDQRSHALLCHTEPPDIVLTNVPRVPERKLPEAGALANLRPQIEKLTPAQVEAFTYETARPKGIASSQLDSAQRLLLDGLVSVYLERLPETLARIEKGKLANSGGDLYFAWAGQQKRRQAHYYRLQGPDFLVEYDNTQNNANHIHAVWRRPAGDFGGDLLQRHYAASH